MGRMESDLALLLLFLDKLGSVTGKKKLEKMIFMLKYHYGVKFDYSFSQSYYGPESDDLSAIMDTLVGVGLIEEVSIVIGQGRAETSYRLTKEGKLLLKELNTSLSKNNSKEVKIITEGTKELNSITSTDLIKRTKDMSESLLLNS